jgi:hypothetical protein
MALRCWIASGAVAAGLLAGCGSSSHKTASSAPKTASGPPPGVSSGPPPGTALPPGAPPALRSVFGRVLVSGEFPGFTPEGRRQLGVNADSWIGQQEATPPQRAREVTRLRALGFVAAVRERLLPVNGGRAEGLSIVEKFRSPAAAREELTHQVQSVKAAGPTTVFTVPAVPGAEGFGGASRANSGDNVAFTKGAYYYIVGAGWRTGEPHPPTREVLIGAAQRLYKRVHA